MCKIIQGATFYVKDETIKNLYSNLKLQTFIKETYLT